MRYRILIFVPAGVSEDLRSRNTRDTTQIYKII